ncbi:aldehyde dehydrogenase family protein [Streptomyces olivochromogenes]|uniref:aldehyde dehydrogenase family protein n=1 Tax=Streptomyces olivochromogenes TaxID=1963 RepID=UPI001F441CDA|nr:aldehyde dehydrogenase family protein [Streptomyces olivochromogenes]
MAPVELRVGSRWQASAGSRRTRDVTSSFGGSTVDTVEVALAAAERGAAVWRRTPSGSAVALGGYANAGQVCISVQRVITHPDITADFLDALVSKVKAIRTGDPSSPAPGQAAESTDGTGAGRPVGHADTRLRPVQPSTVRVRLRRPRRTGRVERGSDPDQLRPRLANPDWNHRKATA